MIVVVDVETGGLDPGRHSLLQVALVLVDPAAKAVVESHSWRVRQREYVLSPFVVAEPAFLRNVTAAESEGHPAGHVASECRVQLSLWAGRAGRRLTLAGINVGRFDAVYLRQLVGSDVFDGTVSHRMVEVACLFLRPGEASPPNSAEVFRRAGVANADPHDALADATATAGAYLAWARGEYLREG